MMPKPEHECEEVLQVGSSQQWELPSSCLHPGLRAILRPLLALISWVNIAVVNIWPLPGKAVFPAPAVEFLCFAGNNLSHLTLPHQIHFSWPGPKRGSLRARPGNEH